MKLKDIQKQFWWHFVQINDSKDILQKFLVYLVLMIPITLTTIFHAYRQGKDYAFHISQRNLYN